MPQKNDYRQRLEQEMGGLIDALELTDMQKRFLRLRWLDRIVWMEGKADRARDWYYRLRLTTIIGGVIILALVSLNIGGTKFILNSLLIHRGFIAICSSSFL